jgi:hypothetical protein
MGKPGNKKNRKNITARVKYTKDLIKRLQRPFHFKDIESTGGNNVIWAQAIERM